MSFFHLPINYNMLHPNDLSFVYNYEDKSVKPVINKTFFSYLNTVKENIENYATDWDKYKKFTNPYEYIHTIIPNTNQSICKIKPLSRSFYKMVEICNLLYLFENIDKSMTSFHLAEGPGGFIEAVCSLRNNMEDKYYGMTLIDNNINIPGWKKSKFFLSKHENVIIEDGKDGTGNLLSVENIKYCFEKYKGQMDLITGDGGFDFSVNFNEQEIMSTKLILCQIIYAIAMQKYNGHFVLKVFDIFTKSSIDIIYIYKFII